MRVIVSILFCLIITSASYAQMDTVQLKEVEIKEQFPLFPGITKSEADTFRLAKSVSSSLSSVLSFEPGLHVRSYGDGGLSTVSFRGAEASHTKVIWNGMPVNSVMNGQVDFSLIPASPTDRIDLYYGANSLAYSQGSLGGTIQMNSGSFNKLKNGLEIKTEIGSFGLVNAYGGFVMGNKLLKSFTRVSFHKADNNYPYFNVAVLPHQKMTQENAGFKRLNLVEEIFLKLKTGEISLRYWQTNAERDIPSLMPNVNSASHLESQSDASSRLITEWNYTKNCFRFFLREGINTSSLDYLLEHYSENQLVTFIHSKSKEFSNYSEAGLRYCVSSKLIFNSTISFLSSSVKINEEKSVQGYSKQFSTMNGMIDLESYLSKWLNVTALARISKQDNYLLNVSPGLYLSFFQTKKLSVKTAISKNTNYPSLNDLYFIPGGNPDLKPEHGFQSDIKTSYVNNIGRISLSAEAVLFYSDITDWILWQPTQYGYWTPENIRHVISKGIQTKLSAKIPWNKLSLQVTGSYTNNPASSMDDQSEINQLPYLPVHSGFISGCFRISKLEFMVEEEMQGIRYSSQTNSYFNSLDPYFLTNTSIQYSFLVRKSKFSIEFRLNNIFNQEYQLIRWRSVPGRNGSLVLSYKI